MFVLTLLLLLTSWCEITQWLELKNQLKRKIIRFYLKKRSLNVKLFISYIEKENSVFKSVPSRAMSSLPTQNNTQSLQDGITLPLVYIMVVDDDCDDTLIIKETIREISPKYRVICLDKGQLVFQTLDKLMDTELPSLLILDFNLPIISGFELLREIKAHKRYQHIPVGVYSNSIYPKHKEECLEAGACAYLTKSSTAQGLRDDMKLLLSHCL